jgi:hypothetical protein
MIPACPEGVLHLVARLSAIGVCLGCLELLSHAFRGKAGGGREESAPEKAAQWGAGTWHIGLPVLVAGRLVLGALLLLDLDVGLYWKYYVPALLVLSVLVSMMLPLAQGADAQLNAIIYSAISLTLLSDTPVAARYCLYFLTLQLCFAYFAAGYHKLRSPAWRDGSALPGILSARLFGFPAFGAWLGRHRALWLPLSWGTVLWEMSFPIVLVAPRGVCLFYLGCGIVFHVGTAVTMGLNKFIWAFLALYPAAVYCTAGSLASLPGAVRSEAARRCRPPSAVKNRPSARPPLHRFRVWYKRESKP